MAIGKDFSHLCPDQSKFEAARKAHVDRELGKVEASGGKPTKQLKRQVSLQDKLRADEARRVAGGFTRGGHR